MEVCCSSWASVDSICATCDSVELICDWLGAGPGSVVEVVAPAAPRGRSHDPKAPATSAARAIRVRPRTVFRQSTAPTWEIVTAPRWQVGHPAGRSPVADPVREDFTHDPTRFD